jgi:hypothetical protein
MMSLVGPLADVPEVVSVMLLLLGVALLARCCLNVTANDYPATPGQTSRRLQRHTGSMLAAPGASLGDLKARMGHDSARAAMIYQHATAEAVRMITDALDKRIEDSGKAANRGPDHDSGTAGTLAKTG